MTKLAQLRAMYQQVLDGIAPSGVNDADLYAAAHYQHTHMLQAIASMPDADRATQSMSWSDESDGDVPHDCLVPFEQTPEGFRLAMQAQIGGSILLLHRAGFRISRVN